MSSKVESATSPLDVVKLLLALAVVVGGVYGFYQFAADYPVWARALGLLALIGVAIAIAATTHAGGKALRFAADANLERRKVVWPTRQETLQTTLIVIVAVIIVSILLWLTDSFFNWAIRALLGY